jgi:CrcB protein
MAEEGAGVMEDWVLVMTGGGIGALLRFWIGRFAVQVYRGRFPVGTFSINVVGSFALGALWALTGGAGWVWLWLGTGVLGGFTTFSTFGVEAVTLLQERRVGMALLYVLGSGVLGVLGAWSGFSMLY